MISHGAILWDRHRDRSRAEARRSAATTAAARSSSAASATAATPCDLKITKRSALDLTYTKPSATDDSELRLALVLASDATKVIQVPLAGSRRRTTGWTTRTADLSAYAGRRVAALGLVVRGRTTRAALTVTMSAPPAR
ncbi:hypothetical protein ABZ897_55975 [Nonomuraea sp. NPDC046802]|uniref:hypothetical protein n=1 Tax=Nonomuraea sp. NPDC046802 TaxID=3154919 RepID=UPI0033DEE2F8